MKPVNIHLSIRRWHDKVYGNSYFAARIYADGLEIARIPLQYGYGSQPVAVALVAARQAEIAFGDTGACYLNSACADAGIRYTEDDAKATKREALNHGKNGD